MSVGASRSLSEGEFSTPRSGSGMSDAGGDQQGPTAALVRLDSEQTTIKNSLKWCFGFNKDLRDGVINLTDGHNRRIFYVAGHTGIIYDVQRHRQLLLQGHSNAITAVCASPDRRWIATADTGPDSMIVVWDALTGEPIKTILSPHENGVLAMDMSPDAMFLVTLSNEMPQTLTIWDWTVDRQGQDSGLISATVTAEDIQTCVRFNTADYQQIITNGTRRAVFWHWSGSHIRFQSPSLAPTEAPQRLGEFTVSMFVTGTNTAITGTVDGDVVVWEPDNDPRRADPLSDLAPASARPQVPADELDWTVVKAVHLHDQPITVLHNIGPYVCTAAADGFVRFFDQKLRLIAWFEDIAAGPVRSVSFCKQDFGPGKTLGGTAGTDGTFRTPDFTVSTGNGLVVWMKSFLFEETDAEYRKGQLVMQGMEGAVHGLAAHPARNEVAVATYGGQLYVWDYEEPKLVMVKIFDGLLAHCVAYDPKGNLLAVGFTNGSVRLLNADNLEELRSFKFSKDSITHIAFGPDGKCFATADNDKCVGLYRFEKVTVTDENMDKHVEERWEFIGKFRSHSKPIVALSFGVAKDGATRLISVGEDRMLYEYHLSGSTITGGIVLKKKFMVAHTATPTAATWMPTPDASSRTAEDMVVVANNQYKLKAYNINSAVLRRTALGPTFGGPLTRLELLPRHDQQFMVYATQEKVIGLLKLPVDGNPNASMGLIAHAGPVADCRASFDGHYVLTSGGEDGVLAVWAVHTEALDAQIQSAPQGVEAFIALIEGGRDGEFFRDLESYFYYAQLKSQGEASMQEYKITRSVAIEQVPDFMRALGFYPTEFEVQELLNEMRYAKFQETGETCKEIEFEDLIRLYVNHRPVMGLGKDDVRRAFELLGGAKGTGLIDRDSLLAELQRHGEPFSERELTEVMRVLLGPDTRISERLPQRITSDEFAEQVLGFEEEDAAAAAAAAAAPEMPASETV